MDDINQLIDFSICNRNPEAKNHPKRENIYTSDYSSLGSFFLQENMDFRQKVDFCSLLRQRLKCTLSLAQIQIKYCIFLPFMVDFMKQMPYFGFVG